MPKLKHIAAALALSLSAIVMPQASRASAFAAWQVTNVPWGDLLNARKYPSPRCGSRPPIQT
jgi:hypothetical protein